MNIEIRANAKDAGRPLKHFWSECVGAGRANEGLRAAWQEQLKLAKEHCGFRYCRFHGLFHDDMFIYQERDGRAVYNFQYVNELFDRLLDAGVKPFVELGFSPGDLAREKGTVFWWKGNGSPPTDLNKWGELVARTVQNWVNRYGIDEVRSWYFEVWNEPNLHPFFRGTKQEYFDLYKITMIRIKQIDSRLRVGGPATSNFVPDARFDGEIEDVSQHCVVLNSKSLDELDWKPVWLQDFLDFCQRETLPVDFVSCHPYPTDWALDGQGQTVKSTRGVDSTRRDLSLLRRLIDASAFPNAEIHLTEWSSSPSPRDFTHDFLQAATFVVKTNVESIGLVDSLSYWTFTDVFEEGGAGDAAFHGGFGMINYQGIPKPTFHAYRFLHQLGNQVLAQKEGCILTRHDTTRKVVGLAYHYPCEVKQSVPASFDSRDTALQVLNLGTPRALEVRLSGLSPGALFVIETLDREHGNVMAAFEAMGSPDPLSREHVSQLKDRAMATSKDYCRASESGELTYRGVLPPWSVSIIREI